MADRWALFDVNGTLLDPSRLADAWGDDAERARPLIFPALSQAVNAADVDTLTGVFRPLPELLRAALERQAQLAGLDPGPAADAIELTRTMDAYPDVAAGLDALAAAGLKLAAVTNSAGESATEALRNAGILDRLEFVMGVDEVEVFKPHPTVYAQALTRTAGRGEDTWFVASHWWDVTGAKRAGMRTAWLAREERVLLGSTPEPDISAADLAEAVPRIVSGA